MRSVVTRLPKKLTLETGIQMTNNQTNIVETQYKNAIQFLGEQTKFGINLGLSRIECLLDCMDNPHKKQVKYVHIGGTNGKGSTTAFLNAILQEAGYKVGVFSSPHLHSYCERYVINSRNIAKADVVELIEGIKPELAKMKATGMEAPTEFELSTAMALKYFTQQNCDFALMEVGLGGDIDSTNVITPEVSIITNVAMDHMEYMGDTITEIATVKSGIIKAEKPIFTAAKKADAVDVITKKAAATNSKLAVIDQNFTVENSTFDGKFQTFDLQIGDHKISNLQISILGKHQLDNASLAVMTALELGVSEDVIRTALPKSKWAGRLEIISENPLIVIDGAHNFDGVQALKSAITEYWQNKKIVAVLGMLADKERERALGELLPLIDEAVVTKVPNPRAGNWQEIGNLCETFHVQHQEIEDVATAVETAKKIAADQGKMLLVTGSLYMLATARAYLLNIENEN